MRVNAQWTPRGVVLWLIAAIAATFAVCAESPSATDPAPPSNRVTFEVAE